MTRCEARDGKGVKREAHAPARSLAAYHGFAIMTFDEFLSRDECQ
jgi:hypothetical protein